MPFASSEMPPVYPRCSTHCELLLVFYLPQLQMFDNLQRSLLADSANIRLDANDPAWAQAVLPVWSGGLGAWSASQLAPSAILASAAGSFELTNQVLPEGLLHALPMSSLGLRMDNEVVHLYTTVDNGEPITAPSTCS